MQRRMATTPNESDCKMERNFRRSSKAFERNDTRIQKKVESQATTRQEASKRPLPDSSNTPPSIQPQRKKTL